MSVPDSDLTRFLLDTVRAYDGQGFHRTGTEGDAASAAWLAAEAQAHGAEAWCEAFPLQQVVPRAAWLEAEGRRLEGVPLFDAAFTDGDGVTGAIGPFNGGSPIGFGAVPVYGADAAYDQARRNAAHHALVAWTAGPAPGLGLRNAYDFNAPFGPPTLQLGGDAEDRAWLERLTAAGAQVRVVVHADRVAAEAQNVVARLPGSEPGLPPLLVLTPRSGWWHCAGERGGGIACWLHVLATLAATGTRRPVWFIASSGHELGHLGLEQALAAYPELAATALAWIRLGASIGAAANARLRQSNADEALAALAADAFQAEEAGPVDRVPPGQVRGEAVTIAAHGGRFVSLAGQSDWFHLACDRFPEAVDGDALTRYARAFARIATRLANEGG